MEKRFTDKEFVERRGKFLVSLNTVQNNHLEWFNNNLGHYKGGGRPTLAELTSVLYDQDKVNIQIDLQNIPTEITDEIQKLVKSHFDK